MRRDDRRSYMALHRLDTQSVHVKVTWSGKGWIVMVNDETMPDCCDTIEEAFTVAETEISRLAPGHTCADCQPWEPLQDFK